MSATATLDAATPRTKESAWCPYPNLYEINTWIWLSELAAKYGRRVELSSVPAAEWDAIGAFGFDAVWLMGVWERSPIGVATANQNDSLLRDFRRALPDFRSEDNVGSPYCVRNYVVDHHLGGPKGLAVAREELATRGMKLILDFVPNHVAPDHPWLTDHPEYFIRGTEVDLQRDPSAYMSLCGCVCACGRDPYFPAWPDVLQLNAFAPALRNAVIETVLNIAEQCDGVRCDMAMLFLNSVFERTWGERAGRRPETEYWADVIPAVKSRYPRFLFIAEAYWDLEWELQQLGFDFCYDKKLYDRLEHDNTEEVRLHLCADSSYQNKLLRFIENHDEPRSAAMFASQVVRALAVTIATIPGARLFYEGQFEGRKIRPPVFLARRPEEHADKELQSFYAELLQVISRPVFRNGDWKLCERSGWPDNNSFQSVLAWTWDAGPERYVIAVNLSGHRAQARIRLSWADLPGTQLRLSDVLSGATYDRRGDEMVLPGLYVDLGAWSYHFFECSTLHS